MPNHAPPTGPNTARCKLGPTTYATGQRHDLARVLSAARLLTSNPPVRFGEQASSDCASRLVVNSVELKYCAYYEDMNGIEDNPPMTGVPVDCYTGCSWDSARGACGMSARPAVPVLLWLCRATEGRRTCADGTLSIDTRPASLIHLFLS